MDIELIKALGDLPVVAILIYLIIRQQAEKEKLLAALIERECAHAKDLVSIVMSGKVIPREITNPSPTLEIRPE